MYPSKYSIEIWTPAGVKTADFSGLATNRRVVITRNDTEDIQWRLDLNDVRRYCRSISTTWEQLIQKGISEVRIRRGAEYICGGVVVHTDRSRSAGGDYLDIRARGFLDLLADRITGPLVTYTGADRAAIAVDLINTSQGLGTNWNFGITIGSVPTIAPYSRQYQNVRIKDALQDLSKLQTGFDFSFTADKVLNFYSAIGIRRPDIIFTYPGNCKELDVVGDATTIRNQLYLLGSGIGQTAAVQITQDDANSQANYKVREYSDILSDVLDTGTLQDYGLGELSAWSTPFDIPKVVYDAGRAPFVTDYSIGDYVQVRETDDPSTEIKGYYRIEQIDLSLDELDAETVTLSFGR